MTTIDQGVAPDSVSISEFKARCLALIERVRRTGHPLVITRHGKPVAEVVPSSQSSANASWIGAATGTITINGDIISPIAEPDEWEALRP